MHDHNQLIRELKTRALNRGANLNDAEVAERIAVGADWEENYKKDFDHVVYNAPGQSADAVKDLRAIIARYPHWFIVVSGPSYAGKGTVIKDLRKGNRKIRRLVLATTRPRRATERHRVDYDFVKPKTLQARKAAGDYLVDEVYPKQHLWIGLDLKHVRAALRDRSKLWLLETTPKMMKFLKEMAGAHILTIFISCVPTINPGNDPQLTENFTFTGMHGVGMGYSSNSAVLRAATEHCRKFSRDGMPRFSDQDLEAIAQLASKHESLRANGHRIGTGDVYAIVYGGIGVVHTFEDHVTFEKVDHDPDWIAEHLLWAYRESPQKHSAGNILAKLFAEKSSARKAVRRISSFALQAAAAIGSSDVDGLADAINQYVHEFDRWLGGGLVHESVRSMSVILKKRFGGRWLATKPLGAGSAESMCVLVHDKEDLAVAQHLLSANHWVSTPLRVSRGLAVDEGLTVSAPYRIDLVAAADLSIDPKIACHGACCAIAIEPRSTAKLCSRTD